MSSSNISSLKTVTDNVTVQLESTLLLLEELKDMNMLKEYEQIIRSHCQMRLQREFLTEALEMTRMQAENEDNPNIEKFFSKTMQILVKKSKIDPFDCPIMRSYQEKLKTNLNSEMDTSDIVATESSNDYIDPITKTTIKNPVRNRVCRHVYDKKSITELVNKNPRTRCPVVGCSNRQPIQLNLLVDDEDIALHLRAMRTN